MELTFISEVIQLKTNGIVTPGNVTTYKYIILWAVLKWIFSNIFPSGRIRLSFGSIHIGLRRKVWSMELRLGLRHEYMTSSLKLNMKHLRRRIFRSKTKEQSTVDHLHTSSNWALPWFSLEFWFLFLPFKNYTCIHSIIHTEPGRAVSTV